MLSFNADSLRTRLQALMPCKAVAVALSGGLDSTALLEALVELRAKDQLGFELRALHVHHGLQLDADAWQQFCVEFCRARSVAITLLRVNLDIAEPGSSAGVENAARQARYHAFAGELQAGEALLLGHHLDDQLETLLLRLMRGAGPRGLAAMPTRRQLGAGFLYRPLLDFPRSALADYARTRSLYWVEDESNQDIAFDRNYCRHELLPRIEARWPGYRDSWQKSLTLLQEAEGLLTELAAMDLAAALTDRAEVLELSALLALPAPRQRNLLRHWLHQLGLAEPGWNRLQRVVEELLTGSGKEACVALADAAIWRYGGKLHLAPLLAEPDRSAAIPWQIDAASSLALSGNGSLHASPQQGAGLAPGVNSLAVRYRRGGETLQLQGRPNKSLKKLLQEAHMPPWQRSRLPLLYAGDELVCVPGIGTAGNFSATAAETGMVIHWQDPFSPVTGD